MKYSIFNKINKTAAIIITLIIFNSCEEFYNPIKDKETGKDITLLLLDMNFFKTRVTYKFIDAKEGSLIIAPATITFSGSNANDIVNFSGKKNQEYSTQVGELELTTDPNVEISESTPFEYAINVKIDGYTEMSKGIRFVTTGIKTVVVYLSKKSDQQEEEVEGELDTSKGDTVFVFSLTNTNHGALKSATAESDNYKIKFVINLNSILKFLDTQEPAQPIYNNKKEVMDAYETNPKNFIVVSKSFFTGYDAWIDAIYKNNQRKSVVFHLLETGTLTGITVGGTEVGDMNGGVVTASASYTGASSPEYFGFAQFNENEGAYQISGTDTLLTKIGADYKLIEASGDNLCLTGASITFQSAAISSFSITADVYDKQTPPELINTISFSGNFPETFEMENTPPIPVTLVFHDDNPAFQPIPNLEIDNSCSGSYNITIEPEDGYEEYQLVLKGFCPDNPTFAITPTYSGEYRQANSNGSWQGTSMVGGVVDLLALPNSQYEYRLLWENEWEITTIWTEFDKDGKYLHNSDSRSITSEELPDGRIKVNIEHDFKQSVCDDMDW